MYHHVMHDSSTCTTVHIMMTTDEHYCVCDALQITVSYDQFSAILGCLNTLTFTMRKSLILTVHVILGKMIKQESRAISLLF